MKFAIIAILSFLLAACGGGDDVEMQWNYGSRLTSEKTVVTLQGNLEIFHIDHRQELIAYRYADSSQFSVVATLTPSDWLANSGDVNVEKLNEILGYAISTSTSYAEAFSKFYVESEIAGIQPEAPLLAVADLVINSFFYAPRK